ncbi:MAG: glycoside hydrolase family 32 protein [Pseudomonadota bacterium]
MLLSIATSADDNVFDSIAYDEPFRPKFHFSPPLAWMNDPNGMVYWDGEYHLFYQYHPYSNVWGPMHWGHAVSRDLVHWENLPIALYPDKEGAIWSGSAIIDHQNTSGLGSEEQPAIVALYTQHDHVEHDIGTSDRYQTQGLSYSTDNGRTWNTYKENPVLDNPGIRDFRDPKVVWFEPQQKWIMTLAAFDHIRFYSSKNLTDWTFESRFSGWGASEGVWECPDLIEMQVVGEDTKKHVLIVSINVAAPNGGSGTQYFIGEFDGKTFHLDAEEKQRLERTPATFPEGEVFADFEDGLGHWKTKGDAFSIIDGPEGDKSPMLSSGNDGDKSTGSIQSPEFEIRKPYINFRISGGDFEDSLGIQLRVDNEVVRRDTGNSRYLHTIRSWDVSEFRNKRAQIELFDRAEGSWGQLAIDDIVFADAPATPKRIPARWLDYGTDNYAGVTWANAPEGRLVFLGWMSNWRYALNVPTERWRSAMTVARDLTLFRSPDGLELRSFPVSELNVNRERTGRVDEQIVSGELDLTIPLKVDSPLLDLELSIETQEPEPVSLQFENDIGQSLVFRINPGAARYELDRSKSGIVDFFEGFAALQTAPLPLGTTTHDLRVLIDRASIEVFVNDGQTVITAIVFPEAPYSEIKLMTQGRTRLRGADAYRVASIWSKD